jgi:hypothetical protein
MSERTPFDLERDGQQAAEIALGLRAHQMAAGRVGSVSKIERSVLAPSASYAIEIEDVGRVEVTVRVLDEAEDYTMGRSPGRDPA